MAFTYPNEQLPAGRNLKLPGAYQDMTAAGARWGNVWGLEMPLYFAEDGFEEPGTLRRSANFPIVAAECAAVQTAAGLLDISGFARYRITGAGAEAWLDHLLASALPKPGQVRLAPMLADDGRLRGDMTVFNWGNGEYWLMGSYYLRAFHMRWFAQHSTRDAQVEDISDAVTGFLISGPRARKILQQVADVDLTPLRMMQCGTFDLGLHRVRVARLSLSGESAFEISCTAGEHASLRKLLLEAGAGSGLTEIGFLSMLSMRLEKSIGVWNAEYTQAYTPAMVGLDRWIDWDKGPFIGKQAARIAPPPARCLAMLEVDAVDADPIGFEPVWQGDRLVGITTSGGYGHRLRRSFALALLDRAQMPIGTALSVHVMGVPRPARVIEMSPYDPDGALMRT